MSEFNEKVNEYRDLEQNSYKLKLRRRFETELKLENERKKVDSAEKLIYSFILPLFISLFVLIFSLGIPILMDMYKTSSNLTEIQNYNSIQTYFSNAQKVFNDSFIYISFL
ncbi:hypothetical protein [Anaerorhabdus sp.]|uniref:hypothetical protein n=1 Tax=Anaerorhabdus sp. TaxID=1872524 RepID=UPI002FC5BA05